MLESVTVSVILEAAAGFGLNPGRELLRPADLLAADGAWLVSTVRGICPVLTLDGSPVSHDPALTAQLARAAGF